MMLGSRSVAPLRAFGAGRGPSTPASRRRVSRRGAAMLEALLVIPVLLIFLGGASRLHHYYYARWAALQEARADAWRMALAGCMLPEEIKELADKAVADSGSAPETTTRSGGAERPQSDADSPIGSTLTGSPSDPPAFMRRASAGEGSARVGIASGKVGTAAAPAGPEAAVPAGDSTRTPYIPIPNLAGEVSASRSFSCNEMQHRDELVIHGTSVISTIISQAKDILSF